MAKKDEAAAAQPLVKVKLKCTYAGFNGDSPGPGSVIEVDSAEADRLVALGGAEIVSETPAAE
jgi:hypothetical protein